MPRVGLTRARVIDLAADLVDREGADALALGAIAASAGVRSPSLYKHVDGLPDVVTALTLRAYESIAAAVEAVEHHDDATEALVEAADRWLTFAREHPGVYALSVRTHLAGSPEVEAAGARTLTRVLALVGRLDLPAQTALHATRSFRALVHGFASLQAANGFGLAPSASVSLEASVRALVAGWHAEAAVRGG